MKNIMKGGETMRKPIYNQTDGSDWRRAKPSCDYLHCSRAILEKLAKAADAKRTFGKCAFYNVIRIESYLDENG